MREGARLALVWWIDEVSSLGICHGLAAAAAFRWSQGLVEHHFSKVKEGMDGMVRRHCRGGLYSLHSYPCWGTWGKDESGWKTKLRNKKWTGWERLRKRVTGKESKREILYIYIYRGISAYIRSLIVLIPSCD